MDTGWIVAAVIYVLGGISLWRMTDENEWHPVLSVLWPFLTLIAMVVCPITWAITRNWLTCDICNSKTRKSEFYHGTLYCLRCYKNCVDADVREQRAQQRAY
jgi:hypothetical protein